MMRILLCHPNSLRWSYIFLGIIFLWLIVILFNSYPFLDNYLNSSKTSDQLARILKDFDLLKKQNAALRDIFQEISEMQIRNDNDKWKDKIENSLDKLFDLGVTKLVPSKDYEMVRRRVLSNNVEFWRYVRANLLDIQSKINNGASSAVKQIVERTLAVGAELNKISERDIIQLVDVDGFGSWRESESKRLSDLVQQRLSTLQNPSDCKAAKKLVCDLNKGCGYGCQLHHLVYCFSIAIGLQRTLVLRSKGWKYHVRGWNEIFQPLSNTCTNVDDVLALDAWPGNPNSLAIKVSVIDSISPRPPYLPLAVPADLAPHIERLHGNPIVWWIGQILKYCLKPQPSTERIINTAMASIGFKRPIVGVHVRRTDKIGVEAAYHSVDEYMNSVAEYYDKLEMHQSVDERRVFVASDDPKVLTEMRSKYPNYVIIGDAKIAKSAAVATRYSDSSLYGIILDIHLLSMSDYLVCTFSSQVCRVAYEIMQTYYVDASNRFCSLDDIYYFGGQNPHNVRAISSHTATKSDEIDINMGDEIGIAGNHWNGFCKGRNLRTNKIGLFPCMKTVDKMQVATFGNYTDK